ncbi:hypothetical protein NBH00_01430 [Paraconexibacter antarcticus]|uniref:Uncharacterized protein n=1 Tax=Paraconexibacter antarcticus TaxID=2949664 RepID=A0ABY5DUX7_9ACTN|nr:hypothetical protein [Paraconexibacter antarcticus]UTI64882.1 hypothetical protein NBH00_01430 [Paraconexibacter antarcticus]
MTSGDYPDPAERADLDEREEVIVTLLGRYLERRETGAPPQAHDLLAAAAEFGDDAACQLRTVLAFYEAMRARETTSAPSVRSTS